MRTIETLESRLRAARQQLADSIRQRDELARDREAERAQLEAVIEKLRAGDPDELLPQPKAAQLLNVSVRYLRNSDCPKVLLPGNPRRKRPGKPRPLVRYRRGSLVAWYLGWEVHASLAPAGAPAQSTAA